MTGILALIVVGLTASVANAESPPTTKIPITLPGGFVVVLGGPLPKSEAPTVPADKYRELQERVDRLQAIVDAAQPIRPRSVELDGRIEQRGRQTVVRLKATFKVATSRPDVLVALGCQRAHAIEARGDDGKPLRLVAADDGLRVHFPAAGDHVLRLELDCPVGPRGPKGNELGFEIGLPGAAITTLTLEPPASVKQYSLSTRVPKGQPGGGTAETETEVAEVERFMPAKGGAPLGAIGSLIVAWEDPTRKAEAVRSVDGDITVTVGADESVTEARLRLRGQATEWRFTAPATADVTVGPWVNAGVGKGPADPARLPNVIRPEPGQTIWRVENREATAGDLLATITTRTPRTRDAGNRASFPVGPFAVLDVTQQAGVIRVRTPLAVKATPLMHGDCRREADELGGESVFRYRYPLLKTAPAAAPLDLTLTAATGAVYCRARSVVRSTENGWKLRAEISLAPSRTEVDEIAIELPEGFKLTDAEPREIIESFATENRKNAKGSICRLRLSGPRRTSFAITLHGDYAGSVSGASVALVQPHVLGVIGRGSEVFVDIAAGQDVRGTFRVWEGGEIGDTESTFEIEDAANSHRLHGTAEGLAARIDLQLMAAALGARSTIESDVDIGLHRVQVVEKLSLRFLGKAPSRMRLMSKANIRDLRTSRGTLERVGDAWDLLLPDDGDREPVFHLMFSTPLPAPGDEFAVPLVEPEAGTSKQLVRIWTAPALAVELHQNADWQRAPIEIVATRSTLPEVVLASYGPAGPLVITIVNRRPAQGDGVAITRIQVEARLGDFVDYRVRFVLSNCASGAELVFPTGSQNVEALVQGKRLTEGVSPIGELLTVRIPPLIVEQDEVVVDVRYRMPGGTTSNLEIPLLTQGELVGDVVWSIAPQSRRLALQFGNVVNAWDWRSLAAAFGVLTSRGDGQSLGSTVIVRESRTSGLRIVEVPRFAWTLGWSIAIALGLVAWRGVGKRGRHGVSAVLVSAVLLAAVRWPQPLALTLVAMLPGLAAMCLLVLGFRTQFWLYRIRVRRSPSFARTGSSLIRPSSTRGHEPSKNGSSAGSAATASPSARVESP
ncbi:MAG TPA: hypothetical protein VHR66_00260 [Gemmataceae bacterium]|jgi:hypothetical protein|nr:hypothetical protein [Gemmataceae bacterium]